MLLFVSDDEDQGGLCKLCKLCQMMKSNVSVICCVK